MTNKKEPRKISWNDIQYVVNNLPDKDMKIVDAMDVTPAEINDFCTTQVESGGQFKLTWDYKYGDCPNLSLVFYNDDYDNSGFGVSARGADFIHCLKILMYKFNVVAKGKLYELTEAKSTRKYG